MNILKTKSGDEFGPERSESIGQNLRRIRKRAGLSQAEMAEKLGTSRPTVARFEDGSVEPKYSIVEQYRRIGMANGIDLTNPRANDQTARLHDRFDAELKLFMAFPLEIRLTELYGAVDRAHQHLQADRLRPK